MLFQRSFVLRGGFLLEHFYCKQLTCICKLGSSGLVIKGKNTLFKYYQKTIIPAISTDDIHGWMDC